MSVRAGNTVETEHEPGVKPLACKHLRGERILELDGRWRVNAHLVSLLAPESLDAERYRRLRHAVEKMRPPGQGLMLGITSPVSGDGKTLTSINLAGALAQDANARVLLADLDLRQPRSNIKDYLGLRKQPGPGVVEAVQDESLRLEQACYYMPDFNLYVMPAGRPTGSPYELLNSGRMSELLEQARGNFDYVVLDTPPVVLLPDSQLIAASVDGFLMVVAADLTPRAMLEEALNLMDRNKVLGLVFNGHTPVSEKYYGGY